MLRRVPALALLILLAHAVPASADAERVEFGGFIEGDVVRDQFMFRGLRVGPDDRGGPFYDDAGLFGFLLDSPPGILNFNPFTAGSGPGRVHSSKGTYVFDMVDPSNPFVPSFTDRAEVVVALADIGSTVLTAYGAEGEVLGTDTLTLDQFGFGNFRLSVFAPGIQRFTITTPQDDTTIGAMVDTLEYETPAVQPSRPIRMSLMTGLPGNVLQLGTDGFVMVTIYPSPRFDSGALEPRHVLLQRASPVSWLPVIGSTGRLRSLILMFRTQDLQGLTPSSTVIALTAVDGDGTSLKGLALVTIQDTPSLPVVPEVPSVSGASRLFQRGTD
ncbi:MAG: hypothetical protein ACREAA_09370 [Candidatus Polarisedimenticolia bacterium]